MQLTVALRLSVTAKIAPQACHSEVVCLPELCLYAGLEQLIKALPAPFNDGQQHVCIEELDLDWVLSLEQL